MTEMMNLLCQQNYVLLDIFKLNTKIENLKRRQDFWLQQYELTETHKNEVTNKICNTHGKLTMLKLTGVTQ